MKYPTAKPSSIKRTKELLTTLPQDIYADNAVIKDALLTEASEYGPGAAQMGINKYSYNLYFYKFEYGILLYKQGQWDDAESMWLPLLPFNPTVAESLAKMFRRQHRYQDEIAILRLGIKEWINSPFSLYGVTPANLNERLQKAAAKKHRAEDLSTGFNYGPLPFDLSFVQQLRNLYFKGIKQ